MRMLLLGLALTVAGCSGVPKQPLPGAEVSAPEAHGQALLAMWLEQSKALHSLQGLAKVRVKTDQGSLSGTQVVIVAKPAQLRAETLSPFGNPLLSLASDGRQLTVLVPGDNLFFSGEATAENLTRFTRMPLPPTALVDILLWQPPLVAFQELSTFRTAGGGWRLLLVAGPLRQELTFDAAERLESVRYFSGDALQLQIDYAGFADSMSVPRQIRLEQPPFAMQTSLDFSEIAVNQPLPAGRFTLVPPDGSRIIPLDPTDATAGEGQRPSPVPNGRD